MKLKGLVWFFAIFLTIISLWELSYTWVIRNFEKKQEVKAQKYVKANFPGLTAGEYEIAVESRKHVLLDSLKDSKIFPVVGTTYEKCKENQLNLGLDLQGGISLTMDVSLEGLLKSLSNNPRDPQLIKAIEAATADHLKNNTDFITAFEKAYSAQNPGAQLSGVFAKPGNDIKIADDNAAVIRKIRTVSSTAINQTYKILLKRIDKFGVSQPNINLDESKGIITVELAGVTTNADIERVRKQLQSSANLQFWELYNINEIGNELQAADKLLGVAVNNIPKGDSLPAVADSNKTQDQLMREQPILSHVQILQPEDGNKDGIPEYSPAIAVVALSDTHTVNSYLNNPVFLNNLRGDVKFLYGKLEKNNEGVSNKYLMLYAIKKRPGSDKARIEGDAITNAGSNIDQTNNEAFVSMDMNGKGAQEWAKMTTEASKSNPHKAIAVVLDDIVYSAPNVNEPITGGQSRITMGKGGIEEAQDLSGILNSGKLDAPAKIVAQQVVGATLGKASINGGLISFAIAFAIIFVLMLVYYNTGGWVANIALILNLLFTIGVLIALKFTLTAAGIAGLVLTIGMAVDTNVIIFERIKEELTKGKSYQQAVNDGYRRSLAPVLDAHVTTFLTALILFVFGLGPVLGFATTQMLGIVLSLFCGILVSRLITDVWTNKNRHFNYFTGISKRVFKHAAFKFIEYRKVAYGISIVVLLLGIGSFFNGFHLGVEFEGGRSYTIKFPEKVDADKLRDPLKASLGGDNAVIKPVGTDGKTLDITTAYLIGAQNADSTVLVHLLDGLKKSNALPAALSYEDFVKNKYIQQSNLVQPSISKDLKAGAVKATVFALLMIFVYIFIRFRDWRYSVGTIVALLHDVFVTLAVFSFFKNIVPFPLEIDQHFIAAVLTVIGFSMNDTVIVFDRVREYSGTMKGQPKGTIINKAINDTLSRTIMTSLTVFITLLVLFIFGGEVTRGFAFAMLIGVITGTYSSIFVAAPILVDLAKDKPLGESAAVDPKSVAVKA